MIAVSIFAPGHLTETECEVLSDILEAKLRQHIADRARYLRTDSGAAFSSVTAPIKQGTGSPALENPAGGAPAEIGAASSRVIRLRCPDCCGPMVEDSTDAGLYCPDCWAYECRQRDL